MFTPLGRLEKTMRAKGLDPNDVNRTIMDHMGCLARMYLQKGSPDEDVEDEDLFTTEEGQRFEEEITDLFSFCVGGLVVTSIEYKEMQKQMLDFFLGPEMSKLVKMNTGKKQRLYFWMIRKGVKGLIDNEVSKDNVHDEENDDETTMAMLAEQRERLVALFVLSAYTYLEAYSKQLLRKAWRLRPVREQILQTVPRQRRKSFNSVLDNPNSPDSAELADRYPSNPAWRLDCIFEGLAVEQPEIKHFVNDAERRNNLPKSLRKLLSEFKDLRNVFAHEDPMSIPIPIEDDSKVQDEIQRAISESDPVLDELPTLKEFFSDIMTQLGETMRIIEKMNSLMLAVVGSASLIECLLLDLVSESSVA